MAQVDFRAYEAYSMPNRYAAYSSTFFATLTLKAASELLYPTIAPPGSVVKKNFEEMFNHEVHASAPATLILPTDTIPHVDDVLPIIRMLPNEFSKGKRSVTLTLSIGGQETTSVYHFSKYGSVLCSPWRLLMVSLR
ncbi:hypothetical protein K443DRAFT_114809 [Laccaria amethystina LaAM-08-1]|uniref:Uncharacterized protein n=1 Tax=Laccaria amethystina LaAM-08-1 TaxID=1095629 RepID=A0A0C9WN35_9AGAR|nr:hypothetical protein K443DRAFT_114809 [Laccaria amethystina LaAM-08-1]